MRIRCSPGGGSGGERWHLCACDEVISLCVCLTGVRCSYHRHRRDPEGCWGICSLRQTWILHKHWECMCLRMRHMRGDNGTDQLTTVEARGVITKVSSVAQWMSDTNSPSGDILTVFMSELLSFKQWKVNISKTKHQHHTCLCSRRQRRLAAACFVHCHDAERVRGVRGERLDLGGGRRHRVFSVEANGVLDTYDVLSGAGACGEVHHQRPAVLRLHCVDGFHPRRG